MGEALERISSSDVFFCSLRIEGVLSVDNCFGVEPSRIIIERVSEENVPDEEENVVASVDRAVTGVRFICCGEPAGLRTVLKGFFCDETTSGGSGLEMFLNSISSNG